MLSIQNLIDDAKCFETVWWMRWSGGCNAHIAKRGFHTKQVPRQRYRCQSCHSQFDDLTQTAFKRHHQPLKVWIICLYFMDLNLSNRQIALE